MNTGLSLSFSPSPLSSLSLSLSLSNIHTVVVGTIVGHFIDAPASLNLTYGETAKFHCRHPSADLIRWTVTPRWLDDYFVSTSRGGEYLLSAYLDDNFNYNATEIRCVAVLNNSIEQSTDPASLLLQGM